jgi:predicted flavoprotein YhiN
MKVAVIGGGAAGFFSAIYVKKKTIQMHRLQFLKKLKKYCPK